jgi:hypothetical protein
MTRRWISYLPIILALLLLTSEITSAQSHVSVHGIVRDAETGNRMAAVSVSTGPNGVGTVTNEDGEFIIKIPNGTHTLIFSHLGYRTHRASVDDPSKPLRVLLNPEPISLDEIIIEPPENILRAVIELVPVNYPDHPESYHCFYRETTKKGNRFIYVAEAITNLYKTQYSQDVKRDRVEIIKGRRLVSPKQSDTLGAKMQGGPMMPVDLDVAKNREFILSEEEMRNYSFAQELPANIDGRPQIVISFKPHLVVDYPLFYGKYYLDKATLAVTRLEMQLDMSDLRKAADFLLVKKPNGVRFKPYSFEVLVDYQTVGKTTRISYLRSEFKFKCDWKKKLFSSPYTVTAEMVVTERDTTGSQPVSRHDSFNRFDSYYDHTEYFRDKSFWGDYNIIAPTERLNDAIKKLLRKNEK